VTGRIAATITAGVSCGGCDSGAEPLSEQPAWFARLIAQGVSNTEACRTVGVNRRTGTRWRFGRSLPTAAFSVREYALVIIKPVVVLSRGFLSEDERAVIARRARSGQDGAGHRGAASAQPVDGEPGAGAQHDAGGVHRGGRSTGSPGGTGYGSPANGVLRAFVQQRLDVRWSLEQIAATLLLEWPDDPRRQLSTESLYRCCTPATRCWSAACAPAVTSDGRGTGVRAGDRHPGGTQQPKSHPRPRRREPHCGRVVRVPRRRVNPDAAGLARSLTWDQATR